MKYFFFDIDGTLTDKSTGKIIPSSKETIRRLIDNGHFVALCTGRAHYKALPIMKELNMKNMVCCGGGGIVINNELLRNEPLNINAIRDLINECEEKHIGYLITKNDSIDVFHKDNLFVEQCGGRYEETNYILDKDLDINKIDYVLKAYVSIKKEDEYKLSSLKNIGYLRFIEDYLIIQHDKKDQGIIDTMNILNGNIKDVVVFGDDSNDVIMFKKIWTSIAMGNGNKELKEKADYITDTSVNDGVMKACKHFGWI